MIVSWLIVNLLYVNYKNIRYEKILKREAWPGSDKSNIHAKLIDLLNIKLESRDFINRYRFEEKYFTRDRCFSFKSICLFLISTIQSSLQRELDRFFKAYHDKKVSERYVTQSAFSQARLKIKPEAFEELSGDCVNYFGSILK